MLIIVFLVVMVISATGATARPRQSSSEREQTRRTAERVGGRITSGRMKTLSPSDIYGAISFTKILREKGTLGGTVPRVTKILIEGHSALCISPNDPAVKGVTYKRTNQRASGLIASAYGLINRDPSDDAYIIAQYSVFRGINIYDLALIYYREYAPQSLRNNFTARANKMAMLASPIDGYIWETDCGGQRFVSSWEGFTNCEGNEFIFDCTGTKIKCLEDDPECTEIPEEDTCPPPSIQLDKECAVENVFVDPGETVDFGGTTEDWKCIAGKSDYLQPTTIADNKYCKVYCQEKVYSTFPGNNLTFEAGKYFIIGNNPDGSDAGKPQYSPIQFTGTRVCKAYTDQSGKVEGINTKLFVQDYSAVITEIPKLYNDMKNAERALAAYNSASKVEVNQYNYGSYPRGSCYTPTKDTTRYCDNVDGCWVNPDYTAPYGAYYDIPEEFAPDKPADQWEYGKRFIGPASYKKYYINGSGGLSTSIDNIASGCGVFENYQGVYNQAVTNYNNKITELNNLHNKINDCVEVSKGYNLKPNVSLDYNPGNGVGANYAHNGDLTSYVSQEKFYSNTMAAAPTNKYGTGRGNITNCVGNDCSINYYTCSGEGCGYTNIQHFSPVVNESTMNLSSFKSVETNWVIYRMSDDKGGRYIWKSTAYTDNIESKGQQIDLGFKVIPLHFQMRPGTYKITLDYSNIGHNGHFDEYMETAKTAETFPYVCKFNLVNDFICNPDIPSDDPDCPGNGGRDCTGGNCPRVKGGIDVIYRTIELEDRKRAFPSVNGDGRTPGSNWSATATTIHHDCNWDREKTYTDVYQYITCNRGVQGDRIYNNADGSKGLAPIYRIVLTPKTIKQIRQHNKKKLTDGIDTKDKAGYGDFALSCNSQGRTCVSRFIHEGLAQGVSLDITGTCMNVNTASEDAFNACRYTKDKYTN